ncbi:Peptidoglycan O-acetyltransferase [Starkeya nomas]|uniref:Peptidoglycan O-acetyltransferase n=1 Tax=Starkeya nomas TaxID=2666134 RepID=A0A5S9PPH2_9HYPH|nr:Peptidoglycan O-acetyltransferase [Starkeya nomas]
MAIGLALAMGLKFPRNFNLPYGALSITDFWRRWHMSLSSWFRDYVYIPLGGNRRGHVSTAVNLWTVFLLCGLWHGASWTFVIWGVHHGTFLVLERTRLGAMLRESPRLVRHAYVLLVVLTSWVWFRANSLPGALDLFAGLAGLNGAGPLSVNLITELTPMAVTVMVLAWPLAMFGLPQPGARRLATKLRLALYGAVDTVVVALLFGLCVLSVGAATYSPFLYFRF